MKKVDKAKSTIQYLKRDFGDWKKSFRSAYSTSFADKDMLESAIRWIDSLLLTRDALWHIGMKDAIKDFLKPQVVLSLKDAKKKRG